MCFETEFALLQNERQNQPVLDQPTEATRPRFKFKRGSCGIFTFDGDHEDGQVQASAPASTSGSGGDPNHPGGVAVGVAADPTKIMNERGRRYLERELGSKFPSSKWKLSLAFNINTRWNPHHDDDDAVISSIDMFVEGELLKQLHSAMSLEKDEGLGLKLKGRLVGMANSEEGADQEDMASVSSDSEIDVVGDIPQVNLTFEYVDLRPQPDGNGGYDHSKYVAYRQKKLRWPVPSVDFQRVRVWELSHLNLVVKQSTCNCGGSSDGGASVALELNKKLLTGKMGADAKILTKGGLPFIPCHGSLLSAQSPVIERMLTNGHFAEGSTRIIGMTDWTGEEVNAFLAFLYCGDVEAPLRDGFLNVTLFKMADFFEVSSLKDKMRHIFLKRSVHLIPVGLALNVFAVGRLMNEPSLAKKAVDALALRTDSEIRAETEMLGISLRGGEGAVPGFSEALLKLW